tara:strand:+ start:2704 stop:3207 length:504 start_codon:yes stop_codon:yes gene_type:complete
MPIYYGGGGGNSSQGRIIKIHRNTNSDTATYTSTNNNIFDDTITPTGSSNWFQIHWRVCMSHGHNHSNYMQLVIGGNVVGGRGGGGHQSAGLSLYHDDYGNRHLFNAGYWSFNGIYTHITSNSNAFEFRIRNRQQGGTTWLNRASQYNDNQRGYPRSEYIMYEMEGS